ncbi:MAG: type II toxin-antitoxin system HicB family antitoxin [Ekhidna sp.]|nr:type II toxin-antitoxin system HicB family antitoxin [Ekhidna sp.]
MIQRHFPIVIEQDEDQVFIVSCPILRGCHSEGETLPEAMENIKEAILLCLEDEQPQPIQQNHFLGVRDLEIALP